MTQTTEKTVSHTPGPWKVGGWKYDDWGLVRGADGEPVATTGMSARVTEEELTQARRTKTTPPIVEANARLVAAAPDMLEALERAEKAIRALLGDVVGGNGIPGPIYVELAAAAISAKNIVRKARGVVAI